MSNNMPQKVTSLAMSILLAISGTVYTQNHVARADSRYVENNILQISNPEDGTGKESTYDSSTKEYVGPPWIGNYIYYGNYPQDDVTGNTNDPIKWRVLDNNNVQYVGSGQINQTELETNNGFRFNVGYPSSKTETGYGGRQNAPVGGNGVLMMTDKLLDHGLYHPDYDQAASNSLCWSTSKDSTSKKGSEMCIRDRSYPVGNSNFFTSAPMALSLAPSAPDCPLSAALDTKITDS